ncbi:MAG: hypothetical protein HYX60_08545, partial [Legionella longbeachae]|nr:hypothetical protein [Legionella longbeachae]
GERLDIAWANYKNEQLKETDRKNALEFMIYLFDIQLESTSEQALNELLISLMNVRKEYKNKGNENYIPMLSSGPYKFDTFAKVLEQTQNSKISNIKEIQEDFKKNKLLDVNQKDKYDDQFGKIRPNYLDSKQRTKYNIQIHKGLFHKKGVLFDSSNLIAHKKKGYVAFTLNTNGELSVFEHLGGKKDKKNRILTHSSMNSGAPLLIAGEMEIKNGELKSINTYSGHYNPSLYSITLFLRYISSKNVDVSKTNVYLQKNPSGKLGLNPQIESSLGDSDRWYKISAKQLVITVDQVMENSIASINQYIKKAEESLYYKFFKPEYSQQKIQLGKIFQRELQGILDEIKTSQNPNKIKFSIEKLEKKIDNYLEAHKKIDSNLRSRLNKTFEGIKDYIKKIKVDFEDDSYENKREEEFKKIF